MIDLGKLTVAKTIPHPKFDDVKILRVLNEAGEICLDGVQVHIQHKYGTHSHNGVGSEGFMLTGEVDSESREKLKGMIANYSTILPLYFMTWTDKKTGVKRVQFGLEIFNNPEKWIEHS